MVVPVVVESVTINCDDCSINTKWSNSYSCTWFFFDFKFSFAAYIIYFFSFPHTWLIIRSRDSNRWLKWSSATERLRFPSAIQLKVPTNPPIAMTQPPIMNRVKLDWNGMIKFLLRLEHWQSQLLCWLWQRRRRCVARECWCDFKFRSRMRFWFSVAIEIAPAILFSLCDRRLCDVPHGVDFYVV